MSAAAIWHEVECGGYAADLPLWERLATDAGGPLLELGCGTGRVALHLARQGHEVWAVDTEPSLIATLEARAKEEGLAVHPTCADVRAVELDREFELIVAPMQLLQMLGGESARRRALRRAAAHLATRACLGAAIVEPSAAALDGAAAALPDVRERDGWVYSSLPVAVQTSAGDLEIRRLRQAVAPDGSLSEEGHVDRLDALDADTLEREAEAAGLRPAGRIGVPEADGYLGSTVVILERR